MRSHITWCLVLALNVLVTGSKAPRQIVYQIRPAPLSAYTSHDGAFLLEHGVTEFEFPTFGLKTNPAAQETRMVKAIAPPPPQQQQASPIPVVTSLTSASNDSADVDSSLGGSSSSAGLSDENYSAAVTREEISEVPRFGTGQVRQQYLQLQPEQIQQIFQQIQPQLIQQSQQQEQEEQAQASQRSVDVGPRYEYKSIEDPNNNSNSEDIKAAQTEVITEEKLQPAYSERREKRRRKDKGQQEQPQGDASYAFGYETDEAARHEVADPDGNVKGWYTYVDDEGTVRKIIYTAGAGKGFVILGKEKVRGPGAGSQSQSQRKQQQKSSNRKGDYGGYAAEGSTYSSIRNQKSASTPPSLTNFYNNFNDLAKAGTSNPPQPTSGFASAEQQQPARTKKPVFIVKIKRPVNNNKGQQQYDDDESTGYESGSSGQTSASSASSSSSSAEDSEQGDSNEGGGQGNNKGGLSVKSDPDSSYVFGYETDTANRLEKADPYGNVRGSYSYIDPEGVKRTVHYIAGGNTGFQVIHASPSISRGVRLEAPPGYVVKRVPSQASLRTAESRFPVPISVPQPSAIVYHIHPDGGWKPWEPTLRKKKVKIHRKKLPKSFFENAQRDGIVLVHTQPDSAPISSRSASVSLGNLGGSSGSTNPFFKEKVTAAGSGQVTATEMRYAAPVSRRRHAPQRGYTAEHHLVQIEDNEEQIQHSRPYLSPQKSSKSSSSLSSSPNSDASTQSMQLAVHEREPLLYSPTFEPVRDSSRMPIPNPIQLQPTQVAVKSRGAPTQPATAAAGQPGLDTSSSNHHAVAFTSDGKLQVDVPTVVIESIKANSPSSSSLVTTVQKDERKNAAPHHTITLHALPEPAALTQNPPPPPPPPPSPPQQQQQTYQHYHQQQQKQPQLYQQKQQHQQPNHHQQQSHRHQQQQQVTVTKTASSGNPNTIITVIQPTTRPNYEISSASASSAAGYKYHHLQNHHYKPNSSPTAVPTPPPTPIQYVSTPVTITVQKQQQQSVQPLANQLPSASPTPPPSRARRRHHRSKTPVTTTATTPSSASASSSSSIISSSASISSSNAIRAGVSSSSSGNTETTTMMSSSKRLINRLASADHDLAVSA